MKNIITNVFLALALAGVSAGAFAGEDSTDRLHGVGPAFYEVKGGLKRFAEGDPSEPLLAGTRESAQGCLK